MNKMSLLRSSVHLMARSVSTSAALSNKKNFRKFYIPPEMRGTKAFREQQKIKPHPDIPLETWGARPYTMEDDNGHLVEVPEMIPDLIVPDLTDFQLKPYVSYRAADITQSEFTAEDLFNAVYSNKIVDDWNKKQLNEDGSPKNPSEDELLEPEEAFRRARIVGCDIFEEKVEIEDHPF